MSRGGMRYGAGKPGYKVQSNTVQRIDIWLWSRKGYLDGCYYLRPSWTRSGEPSGSISVQTTPNSATLSYRVSNMHGDEWIDQSQLVPILRTRCNYGGTRKWFGCPVCQRRCEVLYLRTSRFACRCCQQISYASQSGGTLDRLTCKSHKLWARIESGRPKGMRHKTYERLLDQVCDVDELEDRLFGARLIHLFGDAHCEN